MEPARLDENDRNDEQGRPTQGRMSRCLGALMIWDHNRDRMYERAKAVLDDPEAAQHVWRTAFHWYRGGFFENCPRVNDAWSAKPSRESSGLTVETVARTGTRISSTTWISEGRAWSAPPLARGPIPCSPQFNLRQGGDFVFTMPKYGQKTPPYALPRE